jgi:hypothetical protein
MPTPVEKSRRTLRIAVVVLPILLILGFWLTRGKPLGPRLVGAAINIFLTFWFIFLLRKTKRTKTAAEIAAMIERFLNNTSRYPQEWNDFVERRHPDRQLDSYRRRCDELDPLVNCPEPRDTKALAELKSMANELRRLSSPG